MSEPPPPGVPQGASVAGAEARLTSEALERALGDFRRWFADAVADGGEAVADAPAAIDLATLLGHYVALRQEVNLQTRAVRAQQEQSAELVGKLGQAVEALSRAPRSERASDDNQRPLLTTLIELYDALALANKETARTQASVLPWLETMAREAVPDETPAPRSFWSRWLSSAPNVTPRDDERERELKVNAERVCGALLSLITGYRMGLDRVERALRQHGLEPIVAVGEPFDPEGMEVLEAVADSGRPAGEVVEEVRRGYLWNGRVFRFAQVRVARG